MKIFHSLKAIPALEMFLHLVIHFPFSVWDFYQIRWQGRKLYSPVKDIINRNQEIKGPLIVDNFPTLDVLIILSKIKSISI